MKWIRKFLGPLLIAFMLGIHNAYFEDQKFMDAGSHAMEIDEVTDDTDF